MSIDFSKFINYTDQELVFFNSGDGFVKIPVTEKPEYGVRFAQVRCPTTGLFHVRRELYFKDPRQIPQPDAWIVLNTELQDLFHNWGSVFYVRASDWVMHPRLKTKYLANLTLANTRRTFPNI